MIDVHCHILPKMDDGSESTSESLEMLRMEASQGVDRVFLTSHFYAKNEEPSVFLERRQASFFHLKEAMDASGEDFPKVQLGAEVRYFPGIGKSIDILALTITDTDLFLLEMSFNHWSDRIIADVLELMEHRRVILAHTERYLSYDNLSYISELKSRGAILQTNADNFISVWHRGKYLKYLEAGCADIIATDAHGKDVRPPVLGKAMEYINAKAHRQTLEHLERVSESLIG